MSELYCDECIFNLTGNCNCECIGDLENIEDNLENDMEFIWGVLSYDDLSGRTKPDLYTMNDIELIYWKKRKDYTLSIETIYLFKNSEDSKRYVKDLLNKMQKWMEENHYNTENKYTFHDIFIENNLSLHTHFKSIEDCFRTFHSLVEIYCN